MYPYLMNHPNPHLLLFNHNQQIFNGRAVLPGEGDKLVSCISRQAITAPLQQ